MNHTHRRIDQLDHDSRELERIAGVLDSEGLEDEAGFVEAALDGVLAHIVALRAKHAAMTPDERLRDLLG